MTKEKNRRIGIDIINDVPWGAHFCLFYKTKEDLIDSLVPYFKAGLEDNEFCMWVTSETVSEEEATDAMRKAVPDFDRYLKKGQMEIIAHTEWYLKEGILNLQRVLDGWADKLNQALSKGFDGMRITGGTAWLEKKDWKNFANYEKKVNETISKCRMLAICTYSLDKCGASEIVDVVSNHQFVLIRREGRWELIESYERKQAEEKIVYEQGLMQTLLNNIPDYI
ncbi:MAG: MEDS domain-containing protein, partial [Parcubacteria group bacterium]|nr:MEDS domain-containing protein [Parcubacteria group bacterium]